MLVILYNVLNVNFGIIKIKDVLTEMIRILKGVNNGTR